MNSITLLIGLAILALTASSFTIVDLLRDGYRRRATLDAPQPDRTEPSGMPRPSAHVAPAIR